MEAGPSKPTLGPDVPLFKEQPTRFTPGSGRKPHVPKVASPSDANGNHSERPASGNAPDKPACEWAHMAKVTWLPPLGPDDPIFGEQPTSFTPGPGRRSPGSKTTSPSDTGGR
jgi:hypothetical protein